MTIDYEKIAKGLNETENTSLASRYEHAANNLSSDFLARLSCFMGDPDTHVNTGEDDNKEIADDIKDFINSKELETLNIQEVNGVWIIIARE